MQASSVHVLCTASTFKVSALSFPIRKGSPTGAAIRAHPAAMYSTLMLVVSTVFLGGAKGSWPFAEADVLSTGVEATGSRFLAPFAEIAVDLHGAVSELSPRATQVLQEVSEALAEIAEDSHEALRDLLHRFSTAQGNAARTCGVIGTGFMWGVLPRSYSRSPHCIVIVTVGATLEKIEEARKHAKATLSAAASMVTGITAALLCTAVLTHQLRITDGSFPDVDDGSMQPYIDMSPGPESPRTPGSARKVLDLDALDAHRFKAFGSQGGKASSANMTPEERSARASKAAASRAANKRARSSPSRLGS